MKEEFKLCYIDGNKAWFTNNLKKQWGDDWNDAPYEYNAGEPYDHWSELIEDNSNVWKRKYKHHKIKHKVLFFETNDWSEILPLNGYSVENINKGKVAWLCTDKFNIYAGTSYEEFIKIIEQNGGTVYISRLEN